MPREPIDSGRAGQFTAGWCGDRPGGHRAYWRGRWDPAWTSPAFSL